MKQWHLDGALTIWCCVDSMHVWSSLPDLAQESALLPSKAVLLLLRRLDQAEYKASKTSAQTHST